MPEIQEAPFRLTQDDPVIERADGVASTWSDIFKYQVPVGVSLIIKPHHTFAAYLDESTGSTPALGNDCSARIEKRDASESSVQIIFGPKLYASFGQFANRDRMAHFSVPSEGVIINEREYIVIVAWNAVILTSNSTSNYCYFEMHIAKVRKALGA